MNGRRSSKVNANRTAAVAMLRAPANSNNQPNPKSVLKTGSSWLRPSLTTTTTLATLLPARAPEARSQNSWKAFSSALPVFVVPDLWRMRWMACLSWLLFFPGESGAVKVEEGNLPDGR